MTEPVTKESLKKKLWGEKKLEGQGQVIGDNYQTFISDLNPDSPHYDQVIKAAQEASSPMSYWAMGPLAEALELYNQDQKLKDAENKQFNETLDLVDYNVGANRPNITTPDGSITWSRDPDTGEYTRTTELSDENKDIYEGRQNITGGLVDLGEQLTAGVGDTFTEPFKIDDSVPTFDKREDDYQLFGKSDPWDIPSFDQTDTPVPGYTTPETPMPELKLPGDEGNKTYSHTDSQGNKVYKYIAPEEVPTFDAPTEDAPEYSFDPEKDMPDFTGGDTDVPDLVESNVDPVTGEKIPLTSFAGTDAPDDYQTQTDIATPDAFTSPEGGMPTLETIDDPLPDYEKNTDPMVEYQGAEPAPEFKGLADPMVEFEGLEGDVPVYEGLEGEAPTFEGLSDPAPTYQGTKDKVLESLMARTETDVSRDREGMHNKLIAQGIPPNSEAYDREMERFDRRLTDARQQAEVTAADIADKEYRSQLAGRSQQFGELDTIFQNAMDTRGMSLEEKKQKFLSDMQSRGMSLQEATTAFDKQMESRKQQFGESDQTFQNVMQSYGSNTEDARFKFNAEMQGRGMTLEESNAEFDRLLQRRELEGDENFQAFSAAMEGRGMSNDEAMNVFQSGIQLYESINSENKDQFNLALKNAGFENDTAWMEFESALQVHKTNTEDARNEFAMKADQWGMSRQEALDLFDTGMQVRQQLQDEAREEFAAQAETWGMTRQEALDVFDTSIVSRQQKVSEAVTSFDANLKKYGLEQEQAQNIFDNAVTTYDMDRQQALDKFVMDMEQYGVTRQEAKDYFDSQVIDRKLDFKEDAYEFEADMTTHRQMTDDDLTERTQVLNELISFLGGTPINTPQAGSYGQAPMVSAPDYAGIEEFLMMTQLERDQMDQAEKNNILGGLYGLGGDVTEKLLEKYLP